MIANACSCDSELINNKSKFATETETNQQKRTPRARSAVLCPLSPGDGVPPAWGARPNNGGEEEEKGKRRTENRRAQEKMQKQGTRHLHLQHTSYLCSPPFCLLLSPFTLCLLLRDAGFVPWHRRVGGAEQSLAALWRGIALPWVDSFGLCL